MSLRGQRTKSDYIEWNSILNIIHRLERDGNHKFALLIAMGVFTGLRIGDIRSLRWEDFNETDFLELTEKKTRKFRRIKINPQLSEILARCKEHLAMDSEYIFINRHGTQPITTQYVNRELKKIVKKYDVVRDPERIKSHALRKSFARRVFHKSNNSEKSLILLNEIFNHASIKTTKIYIGLRDEEIADVYENL